MNFNELSARAGSAVVNFCDTLDHDKRKIQIAKAIASGELKPGTRRIRNYGPKTHKELCAWVGLPCPTKIRKTWIVLVCDICQSQLNEPGALVFSPPMDGRNVQKWHICRVCWETKVSRMIDLKAHAA